MPRISILYLNEPDQKERSKCACVELDRFLANPRLYNPNTLARFRGRAYDGPAILIVEDHRGPVEQLKSSLRDMLQRGYQYSIPDELFDVLYESEDSRLPAYVDGDSDDIWSVIKYRGGNDDPGQAKKLLGSSHASDYSKILRRHDRLFRFTRVATWICTDPAALKKDPSVRLRSLIVLIFDNGTRLSDSQSYASLIQSKLGPCYSNRVAEALQMHPLIIYLYIHDSFNDFNFILKCYELLFKVAMLRQSRRAWSISDRAFVLNSGLVQMSFSLPDTLQLKAAVKRLRDYNQHQTAAAAAKDLGDQMRLEFVKDEMERTLESFHDSIDDFEKQVDMFMERFKASLELEFSVTDERMSWMMMWFTFVTFVFAPMAFVAAIFGMTSLEADPKWFAASVMPVFMLSLGFCVYIFLKSQNIDHGFRPRKLQDLVHLMPYSQLMASKPKEEGTKIHGHSKQDHHRPHRRPHRMSSHHGPVPIVVEAPASEGSSDESLPSPSPRPPGAPAYAPPPGPPPEAMHTQPDGPIILDAGYPGGSHRPPHYGPPMGGPPPPGPPRPPARPPTRPPHRPHHLGEQYGYETKIAYSGRESHSGRPAGETSTAYDHVQMPDFNFRRRRTMGPRESRPRDA